MSLNEIGQYGIQGLTFGASYALIAVSLAIVYGASRVINFPTGDISAFMALLAGTTLAISLGIPVWIALILAMLAGGVLSMAVSYALLPPSRRSGVGAGGETHGWMIAAIALGIVISEVAALFWGTEQVVIDTLIPEKSLDWLGLTVRTTALAIFVAAIVVGVALDQIVRRTRWGVLVRAAGGDPVGVAVSGIMLRRIYLQVFFVGGLIAGLTGVLLSELVAPSAYLGFNYTIKGFIAAAVGGLGSLRGALIGGFFIGLVEAYSGLVLGTQWQNPALLIVLIGVLVITPTGLVRVRRARVRTV